MYLRKRTTEDEPYLIDIVSQNFDVSTDLVKRIIGDAQDVIVACDDNGRIAGFVSYRYRIQHIVYVDYVALHPKFQGQGIATSLLPKFAEYMQQQGIRTIFGTVDSENEEALSTLKKWGFQEKGRVLSSIIIQKDLTAATNIQSTNNGSLIQETNDQIVHKNSRLRVGTSRKLQGPPRLTR